MKLLSATNTEEVRDFFLKSFQSANLNFLIGSGASFPAISLVGGIEKDIEALFANGEDDKAELQLADFLCSMVEPNQKLINQADEVDIVSTRTAYNNFVKISKLLLEHRPANLKRRQLNIFTTNYDLFFEDAVSQNASISLNDGFERSANLMNRAIFSSGKYFDTTYHTGPLYNYTVEIPSVNLIKLHGSFSWKKDADDILYNIELPEPIPDEEKENQESVATYIEKFSLILPHKGKFHETLLGRTYYDLFRIYANELDKENTLLIAFGFSFQDEHILEITKRALKNPSLALIISTFSNADVQGYSEKFDKFNNVIVIHEDDPDARIDFDKFNELLSFPLNTKED